MKKILSKNLTATFGLGKSARNGETSVLEAGTEIGHIWNEEGWIKFFAIEYGRTITYKVKTRKELDDCLTNNEEWSAEDILRSAG